MEAHSLQLVVYILSFFLFFSLITHSLTHSSYSFLLCSHLLFSGCAVCSLDLTTEPSHWKAAVRTAVIEIRRLGLFGLTESELGRYKQAILSEAEHLDAQADQTSNEDILLELMEAQACGHVFMHPSQRLQATSDAVNSITLEDVNDVTRGIACYTD